MSDSLQPNGLQHARLPRLPVLKVMSIESVMPSKHLTLCCSLVLLPSILPNIRDFSNELALQIRRPNYCSFTFSFSINPPSEYSGLISFRMDWLDLLAVLGTLKNLPQHHSLKASVLQLSALSFLYSPTLTSPHDYWKNHSSDFRDLCCQSDISAF